eukprot:gnl/TRDRNA2_/TRDRNA2_188424_c0_seq1.p1 gnl/TRDRNA2_/TRDRNA2_188424_c0~~gnl/TRDRNA2_/TRDRNA2_188424_c0_seq1.p1  ORF type:complete len:443 (-),score=47.77 gnl/TRDRNA2_/TRDRNA2_188424_c0_seq1:105-1433(-)
MICNIHVRVRFSERSVKPMSNFWRMLSSIMVASMIVMTSLAHWYFRPQGQEEVCPDSEDCRDHLTFIRLKTAVAEHEHADIHFEAKQEDHAELPRGLEMRGRNQRELPFALRGDGEDRFSLEPALESTLRYPFREDMFLPHIEDPKREAQAFSMVDGHLQQTTTGYLQNLKTQPVKGLLKGVCAAIPSMALHYLIYPLQRKMVLAATACDADGKEKPFALWMLDLMFVQSHPGRNLAILTIGFSYFLSWFAFYLVDLGYRFETSCAASLLEVLLTTPFWVVVTLQAIEAPDNYTPWWQVFARLYKERGIRGMYSSLLPDLVMLVFPFVRTFLMLQIVFRMLQRTGLKSMDDLGVAHPFYATLAYTTSTAIATVLTYPVQVVRMRLQSRQSLFPHEGAFTNVGSLFAGVWWKLSHSILVALSTFTLMQTCYDWAVRFLGLKEP